MKYLYTLGLIAASGLCQAMAQTSETTAGHEQYTFESVPIRGGGFVPGIVHHPTAKDVRYCRTDMGGAYRWDAASGEWVQLLDWVTEAEANLQGVESIAIDPQDPEHIMLACGTYTLEHASILTSHDGGRTFRRCDVPFGMGGNEDGRGNGERLCIDPQRQNVAYMGTKYCGLWRTEDDGVTWQRVTSFPNVDESIDVRNMNSWARSSGVMAVVIDPKADRVYAAASLMGRESIYSSGDQGKTWQAVAGQPTQLRPTHMVLSSDSHLYVSYADAPGPSNMKHGYVYAYDCVSGTWTDISPLHPQDVGQAEELGFGYAAIAVDAQDPKHLLVSTHGLWGKYGYGEEELFRSTDGGRKWTAVLKHGATWDCSVAPYTEMAPLHWMFDLEIDPTNPEHAMATTGFGGWETFNLGDCAKKKGIVKWSLYSRGIEETVPLELYTPPTGARVMVGIGDYGGFTFDDLTQPVATGSNGDPHFANTDGVTGAWHRPEIAVRVGEVFHGQPWQLPVSWSEDGGHTWMMCEAVPEKDAKHGHIAVASDASTWIWTPSRKAAYYTTDKGRTWTPCQGLPNDIRTIADKENPLKFYAVDMRHRRLYRSEDGGRTFTSDSLLLDGYKPLPWDVNRRQNRGDERGGQDRLYAVPGQEGVMWLAAWDGLYQIRLTDDASATPVSQSRDGQRCLTPTPMSQVKQITAFGLGKGLTAECPSLYLIGTVNGQYGFWRSDDGAKGWIRFDDPQHQYGKLLHIIGDWQEHGRCYIGTHGRGLITGMTKE